MVLKEKLGTKELVIPCFKDGFKTVSKVKVPSTFMVPMENKDFKLVEILLDFSRRFSNRCQFVI